MMKHQKSTSKGYGCTQRPYGSEQIQELDLLAQKRKILISNTDTAQEGGFLCIVGSMHIRKLKSWFLVRRYFANCLKRPEKRKHRTPSVICAAYGREDIFSRGCLHILVPVEQSLLSRSPCATGTHCVCPSVVS